MPLVLRERLRTRKGSRERRGKECRDITAEDQVPMGSQERDPEEVTADMINTRKGAKGNWGAKGIGAQRNWGAKGSWGAKGKGAQRDNGAQRKGSKVSGRVAVLL